MQQHINNLKKTRQFLLHLVDGLINEQLNKIPTGYNNNIIWHLGHLVVTHYSICYRPTGNKVPLEENFYGIYKPGGKPLPNIEATEIASIKEMLLSKIDGFEKDVNEGYFNNYNTWTTPYGIEIKNINDAMQFVNFHEGLHTGYVMAMKKLV